MSKKAKKQVVSTQCFAHYISLEICLPKVNPLYSYIANSMRIVFGIGLFDYMC